MSLNEEESRERFKPAKPVFRPELLWINCNTEDMCIEGRYLVAGDSWIHIANGFEYQLLSFDKNVVHIYCPNVRGYEVREQWVTNRFLKEFKLNNYT